MKIRKKSWHALWREHSPGTPGDIPWAFSLSLIWTLMADICKIKNETPAINIQKRRKRGPGGTPRMEIPSGTTSSTINRENSTPKVKDEFSFTRLIVEDMLFHWNLLQGCTHQSL